MVHRKPKPRLKPSLKKHSPNVPISRSSLQISRLAKSELRELLCNKTVLRKYTAILKRKKNNGVTLKDLDSLQLELETLLLGSIKRRKILLTDLSVLEKELEISDLNTLTRTVSPCDDQRTTPITVVGPDSIKIIISNSLFSAPISTKEHYLSRTADELAKTLGLDVTTTKSVGESETHININFSPTTCASELDNKSHETRSTKTNDVNVPPVQPPPPLSKSPLPVISTSPPPTSNALQRLRNKRYSGKDLNLTAKENLVKSKPKKHAKQAKTKKVTKTGKSRNKSKARTRKRGSNVRCVEPSKKFWLTLNNIFRTISESDVKVLEEVLRNQVTLEKNLKDPPVLGPLYASRWAHSELTEDKIVSCETTKSRKAPVQTPEDIAYMIKRAEKMTNKEKESTEHLELDRLSFQIEAALRDANITTVKEEITCETVMQSEEKEENLFGNTEMEMAIRKDLINAGIISDKNIVRADTSLGTEIDVKLKLARNGLKALTKLSICELNRVIKLAKLEAWRQNLHKQLINKGKEIEKAYQSIFTHKNKGEPVKKHIKKALKLVNERETILNKLNNPKQA